MTAHQVLTATRTYETTTFDIDYAKQLLPFAYHGDAVVVHNLANVMIRTLEDRRRANKERGRRLRRRLGGGPRESPYRDELVELVIGFGLHVWLS